MQRSYKNLFTFVWLSLKPMVVLAATGATVASADVGDVVHAIDSSGISLWNLLLGLVISLCVYIWKREHAETITHRKEVKERFDEYQKAQEKKLERMDSDIKSALRSDYFREQQNTIHQEIASLRRDIEKGRVEDATGISRTVAELWDEIKNYRAENERSTTEKYAQMNSLRDRLQSHEVTLAQKYHTKEDIGDMMVDKLAPIMEELRSLKNSFVRKTRTTR